MDIAPIGVVVSSRVELSDDGWDHETSQLALGGGPW